ncbi:RND transporter [Xanthomonas oryzae pv. oryzicola]|nr:RND transporter [Xanthomonas oryzae pv. oryzicola]AKO00366.1 RND transporter [Xanthomonas oryzae pv. oryzicola]KOR46142.1 RND transporter [Xanthomonas oryzae]OLK88414.1 RND transporter [Xanthomonas oryzae pv. oryzicola]
MVRNFLSVALAALVLSGCAIGPDYRPDPPAAMMLQGAQDPAYSTQSPVGNGWSQFDDPVLEQLVRDALFANHDLRIAVSRVKQARAVFVERRLAQAPHITAHSSFDRCEQQQVVAGNQRFLTEQTTLGLDATWELDLFGRQRRVSEAARADLDAEQANLQDVQVTVAAEVARNSFELRGTEKQLEVSKRTLTNLHDTRRLTQTRWYLGAGSELDVQSSLARLKAIEADVPLLETAQAQYRHRLAVLLGQQPDALDATLVARTMPAFARRQPLGDTAGLLRQRPDVRGAERRLAAATAQVGVATADLFPRISVSGFVGVLSGDAARLTEGNAKAWSVTPSISWAVFDFGTVRARLRASKAQAEGALAQYQAPAVPVAVVDR